MKYYALTELFRSPNSKLVTKTGARPVHRFEVPGKKVFVSRHIETHIWHNPIANQYHINESSTGLFLAEGPTEAEAIKACRAAFAKIMKRETGEKMFFYKLTSYGPVGAQEEVAFNDVMAAMAKSLQEAKDAMLQVKSGKVDF